MTIIQDEKMKEIINDYNDGLNNKARNSTGFRWWDEWHYE